MKIQITSKKVNFENNILGIDRFVCAPTDESYKISQNFYCDQKFFRGDIDKFVAAKKSKIYFIKKLIMLLKLSILVDILKFHFMILNLKNKILKKIKIKFEN